MESEHASEHGSEPGKERFWRTVWSPVTSQEAVDPRSGRMLLATRMDGALDDPARAPSERAPSTTSSAGALVTIDGTLVVQLNPVLTDGAVRDLRDMVSHVLAEQSLRGVVVNLASVDVMDSYITRCIRDLAVGARLMGVPTVVCGVQPAVADTLVEMDLGFGDVRTALNIDRALRLLRAVRRAGA